MAARCSFLSNSYPAGVLPEEIARLRERLGFSMSRLAKELGVEPDLVVDWESGEKFPTKKHHQALMTLQQGLADNV